MISAAVAFALATSAAGTAGAATKKKAPVVAAAPAATQEELMTVREQLKALSDRLQKLEQSNQQLSQENAELKAETAKVEANSKEVEKSNDSQTDAIAKTAAKVAAADWASKIKFAGDFRYRDEQIQRDLRSNQTRDRIRARFGFTAKATDSITVGLRLATGSDDPRSPNQTIGAADTGMARRSIGLDQYYASWKVGEGFTVTGGKMAYPYWRTGTSLLNDADINPEGLAVTYQEGIFFANAFGLWITERGAANYDPSTGVTSAIGQDRQGTIYSGLQLGLKVPFSSDTNLTAALMYTDLGAGKGRVPYWFAGGAIPTTSTISCNPITSVTPLPVTPSCKTVTVNNVTAMTQAANGNSVNADGSLAYDYKVTQLNVEFNTKIGGLPFQVWADAAKNSGADNGLDKALTAGLLLGKASDKGTWEVGYAYEKLEKDAYFGAFVDSDFGAGSTDTRGSIFRIGYAPAKNWTLNVTYILSKLNNSGLSNVGLQSATLFKQDETYKRLDLDINVKY